MKFSKVLTVYEAKEIINRLERKEFLKEYVKIEESNGRICAEDIKAGCCVPEFKRSSVDGYAVMSKDIGGASETMPIPLEKKGEVKMGTETILKLNGGECLYIPTGGMLPQNADSVIMIEYTKKMDDKCILAHSYVAYGENVVQIGEDLNKGEVVIEKGKKIRAYEVGVLASLGIDRVLVFKKPKVAIISTGDEVVAINEEQNLGQVRDINSYLLRALLQDDNFYPVSYGIVKDEYNELKESVDRALGECDLVLISGGSSVGKKDQTLKVISSYNEGSILMHGMAVKPGKPTIIGNVGGKIVFGLPGHPLACAVIYKILVKHYISILLENNIENYGIRAEFAINYHKAPGREEYLPVRISEENSKVIATPIMGKSGVISIFSRAWGYIRIDKNLEGVFKGQTVEVYKI